jgi:hypothetical protein
MQIILQPYSIPERGTFQIHETVTIHISADEAQRQVDHWLLHEVNSQMGADQPDLIVGEQSVWRVPIYWSAPHAGRVGIIGTVGVDILSGEMDTSPQRKAELIQRAQHLATGLPTYQAQETSVAYLAKNVISTHQPGRPAGNPRNILSNPS